MKPLFLPMFVLLATTAFSGAKAEKHEHEHGHGQAAEHLFISPMGEPFRGDNGRKALIAAWFAGADTNHDGKVSLAEFRADADRFFATLDVNHDGEIDPDELDRYENKIAPEAGTGSGIFDGADSSDYGGQGAGHYGMLDIPEPVASCDSDFNRGVSRAEFLRAATQRFQALDVDHHGQLTLEGLPQRPPKIEHHQNGPPPQVDI